MSAKPELLAPAGNWDCARAAVANGADAIYFGLPTFNARLRADNFTEEDLPRLMTFLHEHGVRGFVAMNTLIFTGELATAERQLRKLVETGVDAAIIQDLGLARLAQELAPEFEVHASTQMTITSPEGLAFAAKLGITRAVLARELSLRELARFREQSPVSLEVFVHGALCVAYSGQCLTSEALGQRSANRGECAQACRMPYEMIVDGVVQDLGDRKYLLSPQDLAAVAEIPELIRLGVASFKIEGRLKSPEYVAAITRVYRKAIDAALETSGGASPVNADDRYTLEMAFSRGLFNGWMDGVNHQKLVHARFGKKRGPFIGFIAKVARDHVELAEDAGLAEAVSVVKPGDGVVFDTGEDTNDEQGGRVYEIRGRKLYFQYGKINFNKIKIGDRIWKTDDPALNRQLRKSFDCELPKPTRRVVLKVTGAAGIPLTLSTEYQGRQYEVASAMPLQPARNQPLTEAVLREKLGRLGDTGFELENVECEVEGALALPVSELNRMRRALVEQLPRADVDSRTKIAIHEGAGERLRSLIPATSRSLGNAPELTVLCRSLPQILAALEAGVATVYADFEDIRRYKDAVALVHGTGTGARIYLATPRIQKAGEQGFFTLIENARPDGVLVRNLGAMDYFRTGKLPRVGDFSLNVANPLTAQLLMDEGLERVTMSYDLNATQVLDLIGAAPPRWFEITLHQYMPMFHMEHCVFAAFLSEGTDHTNCGRPCDRHEIKLRDRVGLEHPVKADVGCRNTVFHGKAQSGAVFFEQFRAAGATHFRVELLLEDQSQALVVLRNYQALMTHENNAAQLVKTLAVQNKLGVTVGSLAVR